jgi:hypothetical protein
VLKVLSQNSTVSGLFGNGSPCMYIISTLCCLHVVYRAVAVYLSPHSLYAEVLDAFNFVSQEVLRPVSVLNF